MNARKKPKEQFQAPFCVIHGVVGPCVTCVALEIADKLVNDKKEKEVFFVDLDEHQN